MSLSEALLSEIDRAVRENLDSTLSISSSRSVSGGDINEAARLDLNDGTALFLKYNSNPLPKLFEVEAKGLKLLASAKAIRVPRVFAYAEAAAGLPSYLLLEWIDSNSSGSSDLIREFGRSLARLHQVAGNSFGLDHDNYIGSLPQSNKQSSSWTEFYRDQRLGEQASLARKSGLMPSRREELFEKLCSKLDQFIPDSEVSPSLLHGDLWGGNYLTTEREAVLIDPAVYYGDREVDIAMTQLFGGFSREFYEGYDEVWPLPSDNAERRDLYQLYPIFVHLNLFGGSYGARVDSILRHYVG